MEVVAVNSRYTANPNSLATDRAHELSHICQLSSKQLFQIPTAGSDFWVNNSINFMWNFAFSRIYIKLNIKI